MPEPLTVDQKRQRGIALNEAAILGAELDETTGLACVTFEVLTLPEEGPEPEDRRVQAVFHPVGRFVATHLIGGHDESEAKVVPFQGADLLKVVQSFGGCPIYGWEFIDCPPDSHSAWIQQTSLDWGHQKEGMTHNITLFQEGDNQNLHFCIWFDNLEILTPTGDPLSIDDFCAGGMRWWDALHAGDPRTRGHGIEPLSE